MVSRETTPALPEAEPSLVVELFGERTPLIRRFADALVSQGEVRGLIGPDELSRIWTRHLVNCALVAPLISGETADVGSGGGLPGIVLAIARPDVRLTLIEPMERRVDWLGEQVASLSLDNVTVLRARAEDAPQRSFDVVTARAVGALAKLVPISAPLVRRGGELILMKGASVQAEIDKARPVLRRHGLGDPRVEVLGAGMPTEETRVFRAKVE